MNGPHCDKGFVILHLEGWSRERTHPLPRVVLTVSKREFIFVKRAKTAPKARNMEARGKREACRPWIRKLKKRPALKGRNISAFQALALLRCG